jgi:hypothetical protein
VQGVGHSPADDTSGDDGLIVRPVVSRGAGSGHSPADGSNSAGSTIVQSLIADGVGSGIVRLLSSVVGSDHSPTGSLWMVLARGVSDWIRGVI